MSTPAWVTTTRSSSPARVSMRRYRGSSRATPWYTGWSFTPFSPRAAMWSSSSRQCSQSGWMHPKENRPVSPARRLARAAASLMCRTCRGLVATGSTMDRSTPASPMEAASPAPVPSVKGAEWETPLSFCRVEAAMASGKVWV